MCSWMYAEVCAAEAAQHACRLPGQSRAMQQQQLHRRAARSVQLAAQGSAAPAERSRRGTFEPTASTWPTPSWPGTPGSCVAMGYLPSIVLMSEGLMGDCRRGRVARGGLVGMGSCRWRFACGGTAGGSLRRAGRWVLLPAPLARNTARQPFRPSQNKTGRQLPQNASPPAG
jgi:hypothetical protein